MPKSTWRHIIEKFLVAFPHQSELFASSEIEGEGKVEAKAMGTKMA